MERLEFALFLNEQSLSDLAKNINIPENEILNSKKHYIDICKKIAKALNVDYRWLMGADIPMNEFIGEVGIQLLEDAYRDELK